MRSSEFIPVRETATSGATGSGNVAVVSQPIKKKSIGTGFDQNGDKGIYSPPQDQTNKSVVLRRIKRR